MTVASSALALLALPTLAPDAMPYAVALVALVAFVVLGRAVLAALRLRDASAELDGLAIRLEKGLPALPGDFADMRGQLSGIRSAIERQVWNLPQVDQSMALTARRLADVRAALDEWRRPDGEGVRRALGGIRGTLNVLKTAGRLRRVIER